MASNSSPVTITVDREQYHPTHLDRNHTAQLPDELLDRIIFEAGPRYGTALNHARFPGKENWLSCASVCRRWHDITLPHSFRYIRVAPQDLMDTETSYSADCLREFLHDFPYIPPLIQEVNFVRCLVETRTLVSILAALPNLQCLVFHRSLVQGDLDFPHPLMDYKLCKLLVTGGACDIYDCAPAVCGKQIPLLLCLFSDIGEFQDLRGCDHEDQIVLELKGEAARTHSLSAKFEPLYLDTMRHLGLYNHVTCLSLKISCHSYSDASKGSFLRLMAPSLRELYLALVLHINAFSSPQGEWKDMLNDLYSGLALCSSLHGFRLNIENTVIHGNIVSRISARRTLPQAFLVGVNMIALLNVAELKHLSFGYPLYMDPRADPQDIRALDLTELHKVCHRFVNLRSLNFVIHDAYNKVDVRTAFVAFAREELSEYKSIIHFDEPGEFFRCDEASCTWFSGGKLNSLMTLHRDILKNYWAEH